MSDVNVRFDQPFAAIPNCIAQNKNVSANALACVTYLTSRGTNWKARVYDIKKRFGWGDHIWRNVSKELRAIGVLDDEKTSEGTELIFNPWGNKVINNPPVENRTVGKPTRGKSTDIERTEPIKKKLINKENILHENSEKNDLDLEFESMWKIYPLKKAKHKAKEAFKKLFEATADAEPQDLKKAFRSGFIAYLCEHEAKQQLKSQGADNWIPELPYLVTWINQRRWEDDYQSPEEVLRAAKPAKGILDSSKLFK